MADKQGRRLPTWYLDAVNMASEVFADAPQAVDMRRPHVDPFAGGQSVSAQRQGRMTVKQPPPPSTPLWTPPDANADTPDKRTPVQLDVDVVREIDNGT